MDSQTHSYPVACPGLSHSLVGTLQLGNGSYFSYCDVLSQSPGPSKGLISKYLSMVLQIPFSGSRDVQEEY